MNSSFLAFWFSQTVSVLGSGMTKFAIGILLYQKTGQVSALALSILFGSLPSLLVGPFAGVVVDRYNRRLILMGTSLIQAAIGLGLLLALTQPSVNVPSVFVLLALQSTVGTFQPLAELASVALMVSRRALTRANSLLSMNEDISQVFAPLLGGFLLASAGIRAVLLFDVLSFVLAFGTLLFIRIPSHTREGGTDGVERGGLGYLNDFRQSLHYLKAQPRLLQLVLVMAVLNFTSVVTLPLVTPLILKHTGNNTFVLGIVMACSGAGAILGGLLVLTLLRRKLNIRQVFWLNCFEAVLAQIGFGLAQSPALWGACRLLSSAAGPFANASYQAFWQTAVPSALQGRVFAVRRMLAVVLTPLALLLSGPLSDLLAGAFMDRGLDTATATVRSFHSLFVGFGLLSALVSLLFAVLPTFSPFDSEPGPLTIPGAGD